MSWENPLGLATLHDKARARAEALRKEADALDARADKLAAKYDELMAIAHEKIHKHLEELRSAR